MTTLLTCPIRFALLTLAMVLGLGLLLPQQSQPEARSHTVAAVARPAR